MTLSFFEMLTQINAEEDREKQKLLLVKYCNQHGVFLNFIREFYSPEATIKFPSVELFKQSNFPGNEGGMYRQSRTLYVFRQPWKLDENKLRRIFLQMLEALDINDADILTYHSRNGKLPFRRIDKSLMTETFGWSYPETAVTEDDTSDDIGDESAPGVDTNTVELTAVKKPRVRKVKLTPRV